MADLTGRTLGKYRLVERLGRGGMAQVYKAYQPSMDRYVAIKLMHAYLAEDEDFVGRFRREARAIANLRHPHIVQAYDFDVQGDIYYMVQEYVDGGTLKDRLRETSGRGGMIPVPETVRILRAVCDAVDYAHAQGCIHRDIKPDNIMFDADDRPVLTDFGIASIVGGTRFTETGAMIGTPAYMSPEQGKGDSSDVRSDIYSLGVVLYEMVTGRVPFDADTPFAVVLKHLNEPLPMPSAINPTVSRGVERVILRALAKDPADRYQTAGALAADLEEAIRKPDAIRWELEPQVLPGPLRAPQIATPVPERAAVATADAQPTTAPAPGRRKRWLWAAGAVVAVMLAGCCAVGLIAVSRNWRLRATPTIVADIRAATVTVGAVPATVPVSADTGMGTDVDAAIAMGLEALGEECDGDLEIAKSLFERALRQDEKAAAAYVGLARGALCEGNLDVARENLEHAIAMAPDNATAYFWRGRLQVEQELGGDAYGDFTQAIALDPNYAEAYFWRGLVARWPLGDNEQALADMGRAIEIAPDLSKAYLVRGRIYAWEEGDPMLALEDLSRYVELEPDLPDGYAERGAVYLDWLNDYEGAAEEYSLAIDRSEPDPYLFKQRAWTFLLLGEWEQAIEDYTRALDLGADQELLLMRGMTLYFAERYEEALRDLDAVISLGGEPAGAAYHGQGWIYEALGRYEEAVEAYDRASAYSWESYSWPFFEETHWLLDRGTAYRELGQFDLALQDYAALLDMWGGSYRAYYERALAYRAMGLEQEAQADLRQALELADDPDWQAQIMEALAAGSAE